MAIQLLFIVRHIHTSLDNYTGWWYHCTWCHLLTSSLLPLSALIHSFPHVSLGNKDPFAVLLIIPLECMKLMEYTATSWSLVINNINFCVCLIYLTITFDVLFPPLWSRMQSKSSRNSDLTSSSHNLLKYQLPPTQCSRSKKNEWFIWLFQVIPYTHSLVEIIYLPQTLQ